MERGQTQNSICLIPLLVYIHCSLSINDEIVSFSGYIVCDSLTPVEVFFTVLYGLSHSVINTPENKNGSQLLKVDFEKKNEKVNLSFFNKNSF